MDSKIVQLVETYLGAKAGLSKGLDALVPNAPREDVPTFAHPRLAAAHYQGLGNPYTGDPWNGALDNYLDPRRLQAGLTSGDWKDLWIDCDDVAGWYKHAVRLCAPTSKVVTLVDLRATLRNGSHVVLLGDFEGQPFALDTNGYHVLPDHNEATIIAHWESIYVAQGFRYAGYVPDPYPFLPT